MKRKKGRVTIEVEIEGSSGQRQVSTRTRSWATERKDSNRKANVGYKKEAKVNSCASNNVGDDLLNLMNSAECPTHSNQLTDWSLQSMQSIDQLSN